MRAETRTDPAVTVVIPTYERRDPVQRAVASALAQDFPSVDVVVVDDGSTDGTADALADLVEQGRIRLIRQPNSGVSAARNAGIRAARAPAVAFLDSDNRWLPHHLRVATAALARHPGAVLASTCPHFRGRGRERPEAARLVDPVPMLLIDTPAGWVDCAVVRRAELEAVGGFDERLRSIEDTDLWTRLALRGPFSVVRRRTVVRGTAPGSLRRWGQASGETLAAFELSVRSVLAEIERSERPEVRALAPRGRGMLELLGGLRALEAGDHGGARRAFLAATAAAPELSEPFGSGIVYHCVDRMLTREVDPGSRLTHLSAAARAWPDRESATALLLRAQAIGVAVRARRPAAAAGLLAGWPPRTVPGVPRAAFHYLRAQLIG